MTTLRSLAPVVVVALALTALAGCDDELDSYCPRPFERCNSVCTDIQVDAKNCGTCGTTCSSGETCVASKCVVGCGGGATECSGKCVDTSNDLKNCGACSTACKTAEVCSVGKCASSCGGGTTNCSGKCVDTQIDLKNCGACGTACTADELCSAGTCATSCLGGTTKCGTKCVDIQLDPKNCGACGTACKTDEVCSAGACATACGIGATKCGTKCVDPLLDPANCGACGTACKTAEVCSAGKCGMSCVGGTTICGTKCVVTDSDPAHCGACGTACQAGEVCSAGKCGTVCVGGTTKCAAKCVDTNTDPAHCGKCDTACSGGKCAKGKCLCGNGTVDAGEQCDGTALASKSCGSLGFSLGDLICKKDCTLDTDGCTWAVNLGGKGEAKQARLAVDTLGNTYLVGHFLTTATFGTFSLTSAGKLDVVVAKLDPDGKVLWAKGAGSTGDDHGRNIAVDSKGDVYVTGDYTGTVDFGGTKLTSKSATDSDVFIWKLDTKGNTAWAVSAGGSDADEGGGIAVDSTGNSYVGGMFGGTATFGAKTLTSAGDGDGFLAKLDSKGAFVWAVQMGGSNKDWVRQAVVDSTGNVYAAGSFNKEATFVDPATKAANTSGNAVFALKVDNAGKVGWLSVPGASGKSYGNWIALDGAGNVYVTGAFSAALTLGTKTLTPKKNYDLFVWKMDAAGKHVWAFQSQADNSAFGSVIAADAQGNSYVGGYIAGGGVTIGGDKLPNMYGNDALVFKLDKDGKVQWIYPGYSSEDAELYGLALGPKDLHVSGEFKLTFTAGAKTLVSSKYQQTENDMFVWTLPKNCTGAACAKPCGTGLTTCSGACVSLQIDENNCGACGTKCTAGQNCCGGKCLDLLTSNTHCGKCGNSCSASEPCTNGACVSTAKKVVFITSKKYTGNLGGVTGADAKCNTLAAAAGLTGTFYAWLGQGSSPKSWPEFRFKKHSGDYVDKTGRVFATGFAKLAGAHGSLKYPVEYDEAGTKVSGNFWSNINSGSGSVYATVEDCAGWNWGKDGTHDAKYADISTYGSGYTSILGNKTDKHCGKSFHLICVQQ